MSLRKRNSRPPQTPTRRTMSSIALGLGVAGVGVAIGDLYHRPSIAIGGMVLGVGLAAVHLPWDHFLAPKGAA